MRETVSSAQTFFMKYVFPSAWMGGFGLGTCALWLGAFHDRKGGLPPEPMKWMFLVAWLVGSGFILWSCRRLKRVQVDDEALYISNCWSEVSIPLTEVSHFTQSYISRPPTITIHLRNMSPVGERIVFIPKVRPVLFGTHPTIIELQALCDRANSSSAVSQPKVHFDPSDRTTMRFMQAACAILCLLSILSAVTGIQSIVATNHVVIVRHSDLGRLYAILAAVLFAAAAYGIQRRAPFTWKLGWVVLAASYVGFVVSVLPGTMRLLPPGCWLASGFIVIGGGVVIVAWGLWWKRQRGYFTPAKE